MRGKIAARAGTSFCATGGLRFGVGLGCLFGFATQVFGASYNLPDAELLSSEFGQLAGYSGSSSALVTKQDLPGPGVQFTILLDGSDNGKIGIGDPWPTDVTAGLGWDPVLHHWTSLAAYGRIEMTVAYADGPVGSDINIGLILNTGLTGPSGNPSSDTRNDTFWGGPWTTVRAGETRTLVLDFDGAEAWNISDNPVPHTGGGLGWPNGGTYAINDRDRNEISNLGFQLADFDGDALGATIEIRLAARPPPVPAHSDWGLGGMGLLVLGVGALAIRRRQNATA